MFFKKYKEIQARQRHKEEETTLLWFKSSKEVEAFLRRLSIQSQEEYENVEEPSGGICSSQRDILTHIVYYILQELKRVGGGGGIRTHEGYSPYTISSRAH